MKNTPSSPDSDLPPNATVATRKDPAATLRQPVEVLANATPPNRRHCPYVVGIGASAGGLKPLEQFFQHMPAGSGAAFVVVQHLSPDFKSLMKELLSRHTEMKVHRVEDAMEIEPDSIYLIPPAKNMLIVDGKLQLHDPEGEAGHRPTHPIDQFFKSLAEDLGERAIGVVLSGTGTDGAHGLREIAEVGGVVLVQAPDTAEFDGMPRSAISTGITHFIQAPDQLARTVFGYVRRIDDHQETRGPLSQELMDPIILAEVTAILRSDEGLDFSHYKPTTMARRISRRMVISGFDRVTDYLKELSTNASERTALRIDLLIGVTSFFRDPPMWQRLDQDVLPKLIEQAENGLRIWVTACSTGEEVYSLAMLVVEAMERAGKRLDVKIFATDIDRPALEKASTGVYPEAIAGDVSEARLARFFVRRANRYNVKRQLREMIIFSPHDLTRDAPFTKLDLLTCRNVLIYMQTELQRRIIATIHFALRPQGVVVLGTAESVADLENEFETIDKKWKIYTKKRDVVLPMESRRPLVPASSRLVLRQSTDVPPPRLRNDIILTESYRALLTDMDATCLVVTPGIELLHAFGRVDELLRVPEGVVTNELTRMLPHDLVLPLRTAVHRARLDAKTITYDRLQLGSGDNIRHLDMRVTYHEDPRAGEFVLVLLTPADAPSDDEETRYDVNVAAADHIKDLERELQHSRENLQATIEELETTNEEQQASNEELLASNEELQSTNEELHSVNEELYTVNAEHQQKITELTELNNDMDNLLAATDIGTVFLDANLQIRKFTPAITRFIRLVEHDIGRPLEHLTNNLRGVELTKLTRQVIETGTPIEREATNHDGIPLLIRIRPYLTDGDTAGGVVIALVDVSSLKKAQSQLEKSEQRFRELAENIEQVFWVYSADGHNVEYVSPAFESVWGRSRQSLYESPSRWLDAIHDADRPQVRDAWAAMISGARDFNMKYRIIRPDGALRWIHDRGSAVRSESGAVSRIVGVAEDITLRQNSEDRLSLLLSLDEAFIGAQDSNAALKEVLRRICTALGWDYGEAWIPHSNRSELIWSQAWHADNEEKLETFQQHDRDHRVRPGEGLIGRAWLAGEPVILATPDELQPLTDRLETIQQAGFVSAAALPVQAAGEPCAVLTFYGRRPDLHGMPEKGTLLAAVTDHLGALMEGQQAHDRFYLTVEGSSLGKILAKPNGEITLVNAAVEHMFGYDRNELIGNAVETLLSPQDRQAHIEHREAFLADPKNLRARDGRVLKGRRRDATDFPIDLTLTPLDATSGTLILVTIHDVSEQRETKAALTLAVQDLRRKSTEMEEFVYTISHDLKSPLVTISGLAGFAKQQLDRGDTSKVDELLLTLEKTAIRMREKIDDLLELSRVGRSTFELEPVDLYALMIEVLQEHRQAIDQADIEMKLDRLPTVQCGRQQVSRLFDNLLSNAIKHGAAANKPAIEIGWRQARGAVRIFVRDNGPGIDPKHHERIFGLFNRIRTDKEGAGVGLALVKRVMDVHHGHVWVESDLNQGATFWLEFPTDPETADEPRNGVRPG